MIDLGEMSGDRQMSSPPRPPLSAYRWVLALLTALLTVLLGGGGPPPQPPPAPVVLPANLGDRVEADGDRLYVAGVTDAIGAVRRTFVIRSYRLPGVTPLGEYRVTVPGDVYDLTGAGDDVLLVAYNDAESSVLGLVALRPGGGLPLWRRPATVFGVDPVDGLLLIQEQTRPGRADSRQLWRAVDPHTGTARWTIEQPSGGQVVVPAAAERTPGYPARLYIVHRDGLVQARDARTGVVTGTLRLPRRPGAGFTASTAGGLLLAGSDADDTVAYDEVTLAQRWRRSDVKLPEGSYPQSCGSVICLSGNPSVLTGIDPGTGREMWRLDGYSAGEVIGDHALVAPFEQTGPVLAVLDTRTGRAGVVDGEWVSGGPGPQPGTAWVYRQQAIGYSLRYGILSLADRTVRVRGQAERMTGDCRFSAGALVCRRLDSSIVVWRL